MKTSILISFFASLFMMTNFSEKPQLPNTEKNISVTQKDYTFIPTQMMMAKTEKNIASYNAKSFTKSARLTKDFTYLKFDVSKYDNSTAKTTEVMPEATNFDYLKFDVKWYTSNIELSYDNLELPVNEFEKLKFNVDKFQNSDNSSMTELPVNEFKTFKFNVDNYYLNDNSILTELPEDDFGYLKFNVQSQANTDSSELEELTVTEN